MSYHHPWAGTVITQYLGIFCHTGITLRWSSWTTFAGSWYTGFWASTKSPSHARAACFPLPTTFFSLPLANSYKRQESFLAPSTVTPSPSTTIKTPTGVFIRLGLWKQLYMDSTYTLAFNNLWCSGQYLMFGSVPKCVIAQELFQYPTSRKIAKH